MKIDPKELDTKSLYNILKGVVLPRPIGWISSVSATGVPNLAPFSFFTVVSRNPPMVSISILPKSGHDILKDTLNNIRETGQFVVNVVSLTLADQMHLTSAEHSPDTDEFEVAGLEKDPSDLINVPRVAGAPVSMECVVDRIIQVGNVGDHVVFGEVRRFHIRDDVWLGNARINVAAIDPVGRMALNYCLTDRTFDTSVQKNI